MRIDGRDSKEFAPRTTANKTAHRLGWCGRDSFLIANGFMLRAPMVYSSLEAPVDDEPSCINLSLDTDPPGRVAEPGPGTYPTYAGLSPAHRARYLLWLSKDRASSLEYIGFAFLYLCGLERRLFLEHADLHEIVKETIRLRALYSSARVFGLRANQFLAFALAGRAFDEAGFPLMKLAFENPPPNSTKDDLAVALAWFCEHKIPLPASWALAVARTDRRFADHASTASDSDQSASLFKARYQEKFGTGMQVEPSSIDRLVRYQPINASLHDHADLPAPLTWSVRINDVLNNERQFTPLADLLAKTMGDLPGPVPAIIARPSARPPARKTEPAAPRAERVVQIEMPSAQEPGAEPNGLRWNRSGEPISVKGYVLRDPLVYTSVRKPAEPEASCIDLSLVIGKPAWEAAGALGHSPTYATITPTQRANYLSWLANGRVRPLADIGYAFLFLYGLERRVVIDRAEPGAILSECLQLLKTYTFSSSFDGYLSRFLAFTLARTGIHRLDERSFKDVFEKSRLQRNDDCLAVALAWFFEKSIPLPASWAMRVARQDPRSPTTIATDSLPDEFKTFFESRYREQFGAGLVLKASARNRPLGYVPASPSLLPDPGKPGTSNLRIGIPNVLGIPSQFAPLVAIWTSCAQELKPLSRVPGRGIVVPSREAYLALPAELKATVEHPDQEKWDQIVFKHSDKDGCALVEVSALAALHGYPERARLTRFQSEVLAQTAQFVGRVIEPDARLTGRPYAWKDRVALLRRSLDEEAGRPADNSRYLAASVMLELGIYIAAADGAVDDRAVDQVARFIESQFLLDPPEVRRLEALKRLFVTRPPTLGGLGKRLQSTLTHDQREAVGRFLAGVALANGIIDRKGISALKNAYRALDIGVDQLNMLIEESRRPSDDPVEVERGDDCASPGELIPPRLQPGRPTGFVLDDRRLSAILAETQIVIETLGKAMLDPDAPEESPERTTLPADDPRFASLDARYRAMLAQLLGRPVWARLEFNSLARSHNLMPSGALDAVNDWAIELFDDPIVIEQGDQFQIQTQLIESSLMPDSIKPRERDAILQSLRAGVVPRVGLRHLQVGRLDEVSAILKDLERIEHGGATVRFIIGRYGAGKSFFLNLARAVALERRFVVAHADITLERRLHGSTGQARNLYAELMRNLSTRAKPEGGAIANVVERWVSDLDHDIRASGGTDSDVFKEIKTRLKPLQDLVSGFDFATVVGRYVEGFQAHNDDLMSSALRWLRAEYRTKTEARHDLDVRSIIDDTQFYNYLKLFASFTKLAGYAGLLINIDEMGVFSHRLNSSQARTANYEVILRILNDCLQGNVAGLGFFFGGTNTFLEDRRRGVYSYEALATRLADRTFANTGLKDFSGPVLRLANLSPEDLFVLLHNIRVVFALGDSARFLVDDEGIKQFMSHCARALGAEFYLTPRDTVKGFAQLLSIIEQNPGSTWQTILNEMRIDRSADPEAGPPDPDDEPPSSAVAAKPADDDLASFKL